SGYRLYAYTPAVYRGHSGRGGGITLVSPAKYTLLVANITTNQYTVTGLTPGTHYDYAVSAFDAAGNKSVSSVPFVAETQLLPSLTWYTGVQADPTISTVANHPLYITLSAAGNPAPTLSLVSAPSGVVFNGNITWTPTAAEVGPNYITVAATNSAGTTDTVIPVTVIADAPIPSLSINGGLTYGVGNMTADPPTPFTYPPAVNEGFNSSGSSPQYALAGAPFSFQFTGTSNTSRTTYALVSGLAGMTIDPQTGAGLWAPSKADAGTASVTVSATNSAATSY